MQAQALADVEARAWQRLLHHSPYAWFWHTTGWLDYAKAYTADALIADRSFLLKQGAEDLAACPVHVEEGTPWDEDARKLSISGAPLPFPAVAGDVSAKHERKILDRYVEELDSIAEEHDAVYVSVRVPSVAACHLHDPAMDHHPLQRWGFIEVPQLTQVVDLTRSEQALKGDMRKGHRHNARDAGELCEFHAWDAKSITRERFARYQALHAKDAGRVTRSQETFDLMLDWVRDGQAVLMEAEHEGTPQAFALIMLFGTGAYYGSACKDPDRWEIPGQHLIQWETIRWLKERGYRRYDLGRRHEGPGFMENPTEKQVNISKFKRGFGGRPAAVYTAEHHFTADHLRTAMDARTQGLVKDERTSY